MAGRPRPANDYPTHLNPDTCPRCLSLILRGEVEGVPVRLDTTIVTRAHATVLFQYGIPLVEIEIRPRPFRRFLYRAFDEDNRRADRDPGVWILSEHRCAKRRSSKW